MLVIHHLQVSQSERIVWLAEELGIPYKLVIHVRDPLQAPESLKKVPGNETGKAPFVEDADNGVKLSESAAIMEYIMQTYGKGRFAAKPGDKNYAEYLHWFHYSNATLQAAMVTSMFLNSSAAPADDAMRQFATDRLRASFQLLDERLKDNEYLAGDEFTAADIMTTYSLTTQRYFGPQEDLNSYTNLLRWLRQVTGRTAFQTAMSKADPLLKPWVEGSPPGNLMAAGGVTSDIWKKK